MRIKDSPKNNVEGGGKKETKKKSARQKVETVGAVTLPKADKKTHIQATADNDKKDSADIASNNNEPKNQVSH